MSQASVVDVSRFKRQPKAETNPQTGKVEPKDPFEKAVLDAADLIPANELPWEKGQNGGRDYKTTRTQQLSGGVIEMEGPNGEPVQCRRQITFNVNYFPMGGTGSTSAALKTVQKRESQLSDAEKKALAVKWLRETGELDVEESA